tara:strand:- start:7 stop:198 length:192 start_codon:yes stop_codon:yes gene_type:complete
MKKKAKELKKGDKIKILDKEWEVISIETSEIGKQGSQKCRLELSSSGEKLAIIRPSDYPFEVI